MTYFHCPECGEIFPEDEARVLRRDEGYGTKEIYACPNCRNTEIDEADKCERCGEPIPPDEHFCEDCKEILYRQVESIIEDFNGDYLEAKDKFLDYIERVWM